MFLSLNNEVISLTKTIVVDISLLDSQVSWLSYVAQSYLISGKIPDRIGNDHPSIVPYQTVKAKDGLMVLAIANDRQFKNFCEFSGLSNLFTNSKFKSNSSRVKNRKELNKIIEQEKLKLSIHLYSTRQGQAPKAPHREGPKA